MSPQHVDAVRHIRIVGLQRSLHAHGHDDPVALEHANANHGFFDGVRGLRIAEVHAVGEL